MSDFNRRDFLAASLAAGLTTSLAPRTLLAANANNEVNLGFISCGGRAGQLMGQFTKVDGVNVAGLCDPDEKRLGLAKQRFPKAQGWSELREEDLTYRQEYQYYYLGSPTGGLRKLIRVQTLYDVID